MRARRIFARKYVARRAGLTPAPTVGSDARTTRRHEVQAQIYHNGVRQLRIGIRPYSDQGYDPYDETDPKAKFEGVWVHDIVNRVHEDLYQTCEKLGDGEHDTAVRRGLHRHFPDAEVYFVDSTTKAFGRNWLHNIIMRLAGELPPLTAEEKDLSDRYEVEIWALKHRGGPQKLVDLVDMIYVPLFDGAKETYDGYMIDHDRPDRPFLQPLSEEDNARFGFYRGDTLEGSKTFKEEMKQYPPASSWNLKSGKRQALAKMSFTKHLRYKMLKRKPRSS